MNDVNNISQYEKCSNLDISHDIQAKQNIFNSNDNKVQSSAAKVETWTCLNANSHIVTELSNNSIHTVATQTDNNELKNQSNIMPFKSVSKENQTPNDEYDFNIDKVKVRKASVETQTFDSIPYFKELRNIKTVDTQTYDSEYYVNINKAQTKTDGTQTIENLACANNNNVHNPMNCLECNQVSEYTTKLKTDLEVSHYTIQHMQVEIDRYEVNLNDLQNFIEQGKNANGFLQSVINNLKAKVEILEKACNNQRDLINGFYRDTDCVECQTDIGNCFKFVGNNVVYVGKLFCLF